MSFRKVQVGNLLSETTHFDDPLVTLNNAETGTNTSDIGIIMERGSASNVALLWDESEDTFVAIVTTHDGSTDGNVGISSYANLRAGTFTGNLTGNVTGNITGDITGDVTGTVSDISNHDTDSLSEGSTNLYFTNARADARISASNTDNLSEGSSNQYFTNARARAALSAAGSISYNSSTGVISYTAPTALSSFTNDSGFITSYTVTESDVTSHQSALSITESQISDFGSYLNDTGDNTITDTTASSSAGPVVNLYRNNSSPANANYLGQIKFQGKSSTGTTRTYAKITGKIADVSNGSEDGTIEFSVLDTGSNAIPVRINENGLYLNAGYTLKFEGPVSNTNELTLYTASLSADRTITLPDATGTVIINSGDQSISGDLTVDELLIGSSTDHKIAKVNHTYGDGIGLTTDHGTTSIGQANSSYAHYFNSNDVPHWFNKQVIAQGGFGVWGASDNISLKSGSIIWEGSTVDDYETFLQVADPTADRTITLPNATGTVALTSDIPGDTDSVTEGSSNLYYTDARADARITNAFSSAVSLSSTLAVASTSSFSNDITVTGDLTVDTATIASIPFSTSGAQSIIDKNGALNIRGNWIRFQKPGTTTDMIVAKPDGEVELYHNGSEMLATTADGVSVTGKLAVDQDHTSNAVIRGDGLNGAFNHGRYGHTLIQNKNNSTTNWWGLSPRDGGNMEISYGTPNSYGSLVSGAIMSFTTGGLVGIGTQTPEATLHIADVGSTGPALHISGGSSTEGDITVPHDENLQIGHWNESTDTFTQRIHMDTNGHVGIGTTSPGDASWAHSTYGNTEFCIDGNGGYGVLHMRGDGAGTTETRFSSGVGDGKYYMAYDDVNTTHRICVEANGNVGIGNTGAAAKLHVTGDIYATGDVTAYYSSDINLKENVVDIENALDKVKQIRGVRYDWKDEYLEEHTYVEKQDVGVIAQEVEKVLPEIVADREDGTKAVKYDRLTALLIEAVKELSAKVDAQQKEINILKGKDIF